MSELTWDQVEHGGKLAEAIWRMEPTGAMSRQDARVIADGIIAAGYKRDGGAA